MPPVVIYTKSTCPFCHAAKALLHNKAAPFEEIGVDGDRAAQAAMAVKAKGRWTVPQICIGDTHVDGVRGEIRVEHYKIKRVDPWISRLSLI